MTTFWEQKTKTWDEMVQKSTSTTYNDTKVGNMINEVWQQIIDKQVYNELTNTYIQISDLPFNNGLTAFTIISNPVLTADVDIVDVTIDCVTTDLEDDGSVMIGWDIISYTSKSATQLIWVTGILLPHYSWAVVTKLYEAPADFNKPLDFYSVTDWKNNSIRWKWEAEDLAVFYNTISFWDKIFIITSSNVQGGYYLKYAKSYTSLTSDSASSIFPADIADNVIPFIAGWRMIKDPDLRGQLLAKWYGNLTIAANKYNNQSWTTKKPRWKRFWFSSIQ